VRNQRCEPNELPTPLTAAYTKQTKMALSRAQTSKKTADVAKFLGERNDG